MQPTQLARDNGHSQSLLQLNANCVNSSRHLCSYTLLAATVWALCTPHLAAPYWICEVCWNKTRLIRNTKQRLASSVTCANDAQWAAWGLVIWRQWADSQPVHQDVHRQRLSCMKNDNTRFCRCLLSYAALKLKMRLWLGKCTTIALLSRGTGHLQEMVGKFTIKLRYVCTKLHGVISRKTALFTVIATNY